MEPNWPLDVDKPQLPEGYEWVCLRPALGVKQSDPANPHPWWIRVKWTTANGQRRFLRGLKEEHFATPQDAIDAAMKIARKHCHMRGGR